MKRIFVRIIRTIILRPYGNNLMTDDAEHWFIFMALLASLMAAMEGLTWGIISIFLIPRHLWPLSVFLGLLVFSLIWIFDTSLVTLDTNSSRRHDKARAKDNRILKVFFIKWLSNKLSWGVAIRALAISATIIVTAPLLSQLLLVKDIDTYFVRERNNIISELIESKVSNYSRKMYEHQQKLDQLGIELSNEVAGTGQSGKYGYGRVAKTIQKRIDDLKNEMQQLKKSHQKEQKFIDRASDAQLSERYGLILPDDTFSARWRAMDHMLTTGGKSYNIPELLARLLFCFAFIALIGLKLYQPRSVDIYLNGELQDAYKSYRLGGLNDRIEPTLHPDGNSSMTPYRFEEWYYNTYLIDKKDDVTNYFCYKEQENYNVIIKRYKERELDLVSQANPIQAQLSESMRKLKNFEFQLNRIRAKIKFNKDCSDSLSQSINEMDDYLSDSTDNSTSFEFSKQKIVFIKKQEELKNEKFSLSEKESNFLIFIDMQKQEVGRYKFEAHRLTDEIQKIRIKINSLIGDSLKRAEAGLKVQENREAA